MKTLYHISFNSNLEGIWEPMIPAGSTINKTELSEPDIPRISLSPTIEECFKAIYPNVSKYFKIENYPYMEFYVYSPVLTGKERIWTPSYLTSNKLVHDAHETNEYCILVPTYMKLVKKVKILNTKHSPDQFYHPFNDKSIPLKYLCPKIIIVKEIKMDKISMESSKEKSWDPTFGPSFTPEEMLRKGVFEGKYINNIKGIPASWKSIDKVLGPKDEPDETINYHKVKSRQPLSAWKENGWIKTDKNGWFEWYIHYFNGRRLGEEDKWQIGRWRSFVARHQGQVSAKCTLSDDKCNTRQRQGLLQWGWDSHEKWSDEQVSKNAKAIAKKAGVPLEELKVSKESITLPIYANW